MVEVDVLKSAWRKPGSATHCTFQAPPREDSNFDMCNVLRPASEGKLCGFSHQLSDTELTVSDDLT